MKYESEADEIEKDETALFNSEQEQPADISTYEPGHRKRGWLKNLVAIIIGIIAGLFLRIVMVIPLVLIFGTGEGTASDPQRLPLDITLIFETFIAFVTGAMAGSLVPRFGWLIGALTQFLKIILTFAVLGFSIFFVVTKDPRTDLLLDVLRLPFFRIMFFGIMVAAVAGALGAKYRNKIWAFLVWIFGFLGAILLFAAYATGFIVYLYFLYRAGKALFEEHAVWKAALWGLLFGPMVSFVGGGLFYGIIFFGVWVFNKIYNWYAPDLGLEKSDLWSV